MTSAQTRPPGGQDSHTCCLHVVAARAVCAERERELLALKGPCGNRTCRLHNAHSGSCTLPVPATESTLRHSQAATDADIPIFNTLSHVAAAGALPAPADPKG